MPIGVMIGMMGGLKGTWPSWESKMLGVTKNKDGTYSVLTQQVLGPMKADFPAMGPFPFVALSSVPEVMKTEHRGPSARADALFCTTVCERSPSEQKERVARTADVAPGKDVSRCRRRRERAGGRASAAAH